MPSSKIMAAALLGLAMTGAACAAVAQTQQSESSVQSAVRDARDSIQRATLPPSTRTSTGTQSVPSPPPAERGSEPAACPRSNRQECRKELAPAQAVSRGSTAPQAIGGGHQI